MKTDNAIRQIEQADHEQATEESSPSVFYEALLEARYHSMRPDGRDIHRDLIATIVDYLGTPVLDSLIEEGWDLLDELLLCDSSEQVEAKLETIADGTNEQSADVAYTDGYVQGFITARYYALRYGKDDALFSAPAPLDPPDVVVTILESMCTGCLYRHLFEDGWNSLDELLLCDSSEQLKAKLEIKDQDTHH